MTTSARIVRTRKRAADAAVELLARHRGLLPTVAGWLREEWPGWYGQGGRGDAVGDAHAFAASTERLPLGVVALVAGRPVGVGALKAESLASHRHLTPWAAAGYVLPELRGRGVGAALLAALVREAGRLGFPCVYCGTSTSASLLLRAGWQAVEVIEHDGRPLTIFRKVPCDRPAG